MVTAPGGRPAEPPVPVDIGVVAALPIEVAPLLARLDHHCLNEIEGLENPTAENIAAWIWHRLRPDLPGLARVRVAETPMSWADYDGD